LEVNSWKRTMQLNNNVFPFFNSLNNQSCKRNPSYS